MFSSESSLATRTYVATPATAKMTPTTMTMSPIGPDLPGVRAMTAPFLVTMVSDSLGGSAVTRLTRTG